MSLLLTTRKGKLSLLEITVTLYSVYFARRHIEVLNFFIFAFNLIIFTCGLHFELNINLLLSMIISTKAPWLSCAIQYSLG